MHIHRMTFALLLVFSGFFGQAQSAVAATDEPVTICPDKNAHKALLVDGNTIIPTKRGACVIDQHGQEKKYDLFSKTKKNRIATLFMLKDYAVIAVKPNGKEVKLFNYSTGEVISQQPLSSEMKFQKVAVKTGKIQQQRYVVITGKNAGGYILFSVVRLTQAHRLGAVSSVIIQDTRVNIHNTRLGKNNIILRNTKKKEILKYPVYE